VRTILCPGTRRIKQVKIARRIGNWVWPTCRRCSPRRAQLTELALILIVISMMGPACKLLDWVFLNGLTVGLTASENTQSQGGETIDGRR